MSAKTKKTFYVEILCWIEADSEDEAREAAELRANLIASRIEGQPRVTSATVNSVEEQES